MLPSLEAGVEVDSIDATARVESEETSGTHMVFSDEDIPPSARERQYDDEVATEIARQDWDDETRRMPRPSELAKIGKPKFPVSRPPPGVEDTVKIEGDLEAHFANMHPEPAEKPRPRPKRR